jgi:type I restriction enzyme, S subunit
VSFKILDELVERDAPICYGILKPGGHVDGGVPVVKVRNFTKGPIEMRDLLLTEPAIEEQYRRSRLRAGDILLSIRGTTGRIVLVPRALEGANITQDSARIRVPEPYRRFVYHALHSPVVQRQIKEKTIGQAVRGINIAAVRRLRIPWLQKAQRDGCVAVFDQIETCVTRVGQLISAKRELKRGLMQELLTGRRRFPEFTRNVSAASATPVGWTTVRIGDVAEEQSERARDAVTVVLSCTKHYGLVPSLEYFGKQVFSRDLSNYKLVRPGGFVYATNHLEEGSIGLHREEYLGAVSPMYTVFSVDTLTVYPEFLFALLKTEMYRRKFQALTSGSVNRRGAVRWSAFRNVSLSLPSRSEQKRIAGVLSTLAREVELLEAQRYQFELQKRGLMQKLLRAENGIAPDEPDA